MSVLTAPRTATRLDELGFVGRGKSRHRPRNDASLYGGDYPFFQTGDVKAANLYLTEYTQTYSEAGLAQSKMWEPGTLCITIAANIAETAILGIPGCFPDSVVGFVANPEKADVRFIKYYIDTIKLRIQNISHGATQDNLSLDKLLTFDFAVPDLPTQRRIAGILSAYDDLIENNLRRIKILEEMAQSLYREWFVHFRFPGHESVPLVDSALGLIPEGWDVKKVKSILKRLKAGEVYQKADVSEVGAIPVIDQSTDEVLGFHDNEPDHNATVDRPIAIFGDHTCKMQLMVTPFSIGPNVVPFVAQVDHPLVYIYYLVRNLATTQEYKRHWTQLNANEVPIASESLTMRFTQFCQPLLDSIERLKHRNQTLRKTRDLLLPKLLSA